MAAATRVRIEPPNQLPSSGITPIKYKQWKVALKIFLTQTPAFREFYPGGKYTTWTSLEDNPNRILNRAETDNVPNTTTAEEHLAQRRIDLETFLGIIARYSDEGDFDDIMEKATSLEWIHTLHERRYGIQKKGRYFNRIDSIRFDKTTMSDYHKFYTDLRSCFKSNLRKTGDNIKYKQQRLTEDEKIHPTTECLLVYMALERIDPRLPNEIDRIFGHLMDDTTTLIDLQTEIFSYIPRALASLDKEEQSELNAQMIHAEQQQFHTEQVYQHQPPLQVNAMSYRQGSQRQQPRQQQQRQQRYNNQPTRQYRPARNTNNRTCKLCLALDLPQHVYSTHTAEQCRKKALLQELQVVNTEPYDDQEETYNDQEDDQYVYEQD